MKFKSQKDMGIEKMEALLEKFDYKFERNNNELIIKMDFSQRMIVDFSKPEKVVIKDKLIGWNLLTGFIEMSVKNAALSNFIGMLFVTILFVLIDFKSEGNNFILFFLTVLLWILLWTTFYLVKSESLKQTLISWNNES